jgi:hypothetical protein
VNHARLLARLRRESAESEVKLLDLVRRRTPGDPTIRLRLHRTAPDMEARRALCHEIRDAFWRYVATVESQWRENGRRSPRRQWRESLATTQGAGGERQSLRNLIDWFSNEYCRRLDSRDIAEHEITSVTTADGEDAAAEDVATPRTVSHEAAAGARMTAALDEVVVEQRRVRERRSARRRAGRGRRRGHRGQEEPPVLKDDLSVELALLSLRWTGDSDLRQANEAFDRAYRAIVEHAVADIVRLKMLQSRTGMSPRQQRLLYERIRDSFWRYLSTIEERWQARSRLSLRRHWRDHLSRHEGGERKTLRSIVEWFTDEYCRRLEGGSSQVAVVETKTPSAGQGEPLAQPARR